MKIIQLDWIQQGVELITTTAVGGYAIYFNADLAKYRLSTTLGFLQCNRFDTIEEATEATQLDFEKRILECLSTKI